MDELLKNCKLCPVECGADRTSGVGACGGGKNVRIAKYSLHPFEEPCISAENGSGTIFFCGCSLRCAFCQNYELSRAQRGKAITPRELADIFKELEERGAENVSLVTAAHYVPQIVEAFGIYRPKIPVVYNSSGYEKTETLRLIDPYIDVYLPDIKFYSPALSKRYTGKDDYFDVASAAVKFMAQKKTVFSENGKMLSGLLVRHMVMPLGVSDSKKILRFFCEELPKGTYLSLMSQYTPFGDIEKFPELQRKITAREYDAVADEAVLLGIRNVFLQERSSSSEKYVPSWDF